MWVYFLTTAALLVLVNYLMLLRERSNKFKIFRNMGIKNPPTSIITGNMNSVMVGSKLPLESIDTWLRQYGKVFGYFRGELPTLVISDFELMKQVLVKDFNNFVNRPRGTTSLKVHRDSLLGQTDQRWKYVRKTITPTFSASKMKVLAHAMNRSVTVFCDELDKRATTGESFDIYERFQRLTLDVIGECALATKIGCQQNPDDFLYKTVAAFMKESGSGWLITAITSLSSIPGVKSFARWYYYRMPRFKLIGSIVENLKRVLDMRRKNPSKNKTVDVLQLMLDASQNTEATVADVEESEYGKEDEILATAKTLKVESSQPPLADDEIIGNCWAFILAGFETTATALSYVAHLLTVNPDIQDKVYEEIMANTVPDQIPTYEEAHSLQYLDQVINETLRLYPPVVLFMTRECAQDYDLNGIKIPAGMKIEIPIYSIHHDPELWPDPEKFDPERFSPENKSKIHPMAHIPFGAGPRNCIGMRFALLEAKLTLIRLIRKYRLEPCDKTKDPPEVTVPHATFVPKNGIYLKVVPRDY